LIPPTKIGGTGCSRLIGNFDRPVLAKELDACQRVFWQGGLNMDDLKKTGFQDRSKINMHEPHEVQYWTKHLGISKEQLQKAVDKVGNSAAAVKKELAA
jgi:3-oxoacyl-[acyl-carrier-protein] synthase III